MFKVELLRAIDLCKERSFLNGSTMGQELSENWQKKAEEFFNFTKRILKENKFGTIEIINMDEVSLCFDFPPNYAVDCQEKIISRLIQRVRKGILYGCTILGSKR